MLDTGAYDQAEVAEMAHRRIRRSSGGPRLLQFRLALGLTQGEVVERLHELAWVHHPDEQFSVDRATYSRWESGERWPRSKTSRHLLSLLYSATEYELGLRSMRQQLTLPTATDDAAGRGPSGSPALLAAAPAPLDWERLRRVSQGRLSVDQELLDDLRSLTAIFGSNRYQLSPTSVLPLIHAHVAALRELLTHAGSNGAWGEIARLAGYSAVIAGQLWLGLAKPEESAGCFAFAEALAHEADDDRVMAAAMASRSLGYTLARLAGQAEASRSAIQLLDAANDRLVHISDSPLRLWLLGCRAWERAAVGEAHGAYRDLETAEKGVPKIEWSVDTFLSQWGSELGDVGFVAYRGKTALLLGSPAEGLSLLADAADRVPRGSLIRPALLIDMAIAWAERGEVERACQLLGEAVDQTGPAQVVALNRRIMQVRTKDLGRYATVRAVRSLDDRLTGLAS